MSDAGRIVTPEDLGRIKALVRAARPSPWVSYVEGRDHISGSSFIMVGEGDSRCEDMEFSGVSHGDQDFIASARQDVPNLIAEVERLWGVLDAL